MIGVPGAWPGMGEGALPAVSSQARVPASWDTLVSNWTSTAGWGFTLWRKSTPVLAPPSFHHWERLMRPYQGLFAAVSNPTFTPGRAGRRRYFFTGAS